jgi:hypothetical protein
MKTYKLISFLSMALLATSCSNPNTSTSENSSSTSTSNSTNEITSSYWPSVANTASEVSSYVYDINDIESNYEVGTITADNGTENYSINEDGMLELTTDGGEYTLSGYFNQEILVTATKVQITLNNAVIYNDAGPAVYYASTSKSLKIKSQNNTDNYVVSGAYEVASGTPGAIESENNIKFTGKGTLNIYSSTGHGVKGSDISVENATLNIAAEKDGIHGKQMAILYGTEADGSYYNKATVNILSADDGIQMETNSKGTKGIFYQFGGTLNITNANRGLVVDNDLYLGYESTWDDNTYNPLASSFLQSSIVEEYVSLGGNAYINSDNIEFNFE